MSTHRTIEYALLAIGTCGLALALLPQSRADMTLLGLFAVMAIFAGLHVLHLYDGMRANTIVLFASMAGSAYGLYGLVAAYAARSLDLWMLGFCALFVVALILALRLRRDFASRA